MKILFMTSSFPTRERIGGVWIPDLVRSLNNLGCDVHIITQNCDRNKTESETLWPGCRITYFAWKGGDIPLINVLRMGFPGILLAFQFIINGIVKGNKICREWKPDVLFAEWLVPSGIIAYAIAKHSKIPYAVRALGSDVLKAEQNLLIRPVAKHIAKNSAVLFADGFDLCNKASFLAGGKPCKFAATGRQKNTKRSEFKIPDDHGLFTTCTVGRLHSVKGQDILINAANELVRQNIAFKSYIVGSGPEHNRLQEMIYQRGFSDRIILTGRLEDGDITDLLNHVDCVVIPSRNESIPLAFSEAVAAKKALIVTNVGDLGYLVEKYNLGYVVPVEDYKALAKAMERMSKNPRSGLFTEEKVYIELAEMFSIDGAARSIFTAIKAYLEGNV